MSLLPPSLERTLAAGWTCSLRWKLELQAFTNSAVSAASLTKNNWINDRRNNYWRFGIGDSFWENAYFKKKSSFWLSVLILWAFAGVASGQDWIWKPNHASGVQKPEIPEVFCNLLSKTAALQWVLDGRSHQHTEAWVPKKWTSTVCKRRISSCGPTVSYLFGPWDQ